jgi:hypothetical protein
MATTSQTLNHWLHQTEEVSAAGSKVSDLSPLREADLGPHHPLSDVVVW